MQHAHPTHAAFKHGGVPTIACFNRARTPLGFRFDVLLRALQAYVNMHVEPVWGTPVRLVKSSGYVKGQWAMAFLDDADAPGALAYHDLTPDGLPQAKVFVRTTLDADESVSVAASHELVEMLVDPAINLLALGPDVRAAYAYESADPVEALSFAVHGLPMSDFVYPAYFEAFHAPGTAPFDHLGRVTRPYEVLPGGYQTVFKNGKWTELFGSAEQEKSFARKDRRGHRREQRARVTLERADEAAIERAA